MTVCPFCWYALSVELFLLEAVSFLLLKIHISLKILGWKRGASRGARSQRCAKAACGLLCPPWAGGASSPAPAAARP